MIRRMEDLAGVTIVSVRGQKYKLTGQAGFGAQGVVYEENTGQYMVKLYYPSGCQSIDDDVFERLRFIKDIKIPKNFVTIVDLITSPYPGYVMEKVIDYKPLNSYLIPDKELSFSEWYNKNWGLLERLFVGYVIAKAFGELEKNNLSYCDISGNNILIKIGQSASVRMIDVDNIYIAGKGKSAILGTPRYIAPEVISRQKNPDVLSDNYSLAVILFELLRVGQLQKTKKLHWRERQIMLKMKIQ
jgi:serine/threonine protein kinase